MMNLAVAAYTNSSSSPERVNRFIGVTSAPSAGEQIQSNTVASNEKEQISN